MVDPIRTDTAAAADIHLQLFPGSDAALAFALMHVIERDGLADEEFLAAHTVGWEELRGELAACTPEWGERVTGVPAALIEQAARRYGEGPSLLWIGQGLQRQPTGGNVVRTVSVLPAVTGNVARPGSGFLYLNDHLVLEGELLDPTELGGDPPEPVSHMDLAERLEDRERSRALVCWNINIAASNPQQRRLRRAMERDDLFTVVVDIFPTDTADLADVVLPAASFLEFDDIVGSYFDLTISAQVKAADPPGRALPNQEIFRRLARAMGFDEPELHVSDREIIDEVVRQSGVAASFEELASTGTRPLFAEPVMQFASLELETPSGRVEIVSAAAEADGHPRLPQPIADPRPAGGRLRLLSPASGWTLNDTFANDPKVDRRLGAATVTLHPLDAAERGLAEGDACVLESEEGTPRAVRRGRRDRAAGRRAVAQGTVAETRAGQRQRQRPEPRRQGRHGRELVGARRRGDRPPRPLSARLDLVVRGGRVVDGSGSPWTRADIGIAGDRIAAVAPPGSLDAPEIVDAADNVVCPGFIDIMSHSLWPLMSDARSVSKLVQGVTTEVMGEGYTPAPFGGLIAPPELHPDAPPGWPERIRTWSRFGGWLRALEERGISPNVGSFLGGGTLREYACGMRMGTPTAAELATMVRVAEEAMQRRRVRGRLRADLSTRCLRRHQRDRRGRTCGRPRQGGSTSPTSDRRGRGCSVRSTRASRSRAGPAREPRCTT